MACRNCASECLCSVIGTNGATVTGSGSGPDPYTVAVLRDPVGGNLVTVSPAGVLVSTESVQDVVGAMAPSPLAYNDTTGTWIWSGGTDGMVLTKSGAGAVWAALGGGGSTAMTTAASTTSMSTSGVTDPTVGFAGGSTGAIAFLTETFTLRAGCGMEVQLDATGSLYSIRPAVFSFGATGYSTGGCNSTAGGQIYCDSAGRLRGLPDHRSVAARTAGSDGTVTSFAVLLALGANATVTYNNPSACRYLNLMVGLETYFEFDIAVGQNIYHQNQIFGGFFTGIFIREGFFPYGGGINSHFIQTTVLNQAGQIAPSGSLGFSHSLLWNSAAFVGGNHIASTCVNTGLGVTT